MLVLNVLAMFLARVNVRRNGAGELDIFWMRIELPLETPPIAPIADDTRAALKMALTDGELLQNFYRKDDPELECRPCFRSPSA